MEVSGSLAIEKKRQEYEARQGYIPSGSAPAYQLHCSFIDM
jgi:hypothetical protein